MYNYAYLLVFIILEIYVNTQRRGYHLHFHIVCWNWSWLPVQYLPLAAALFRALIQSCVKPDKICIDAFFRPNGIHLYMCNRPTVDAARN